MGLEFQMASSFVRSATPLTFWGTDERTTYAPRFGPCHIFIWAPIRGETSEGGSECSSEGSRVNCHFSSGFCGECEGRRSVGLLDCVHNEYLGAGLLVCHMWHRREMTSVVPNPEQTLTNASSPLICRYVPHFRHHEDCQIEAAFFKAF